MAAGAGAALVPILDQGGNLAQFQPVVSCISNPYASPGSALTDLVPAALTPVAARVGAPPGDSAPLGPEPAIEPMAAGAGAALVPILDQGGNLTQFQPVVGSSSRPHPYGPYPPPPPL